MCVYINIDIQREKNTLNIIKQFNQLLCCNSKLSI